MRTKSCIEKVQQEIMKRPRNDPKQKIMPTYEERQRICGEKIRYTAVEDALRYINSNNVPLNYYRCRVCGGFHITRNT